MADTMKAIRKVSEDPGLVVEEVPIPVPGPHDVLIQVEAASICGTDLHIWKWDEWSSNRIHPPLIVRQAFTGTVVAVGELAEQVQVGNYVSAESNITCGHCFQCPRARRTCVPKPRSSAWIETGPPPSLWPSPNPSSDRTIGQSSRRRSPPSKSPSGTPYSPPSPTISRGRRSSSSGAGRSAFSASESQEHPGLGMSTRWIRWSPG